jgi:hypothetical protein
MAKAKKKKANPRVTVDFTPPSYDPNRIGEFIKARYGKQSASRQRQLYDQYRRQGAEFGDDPTGQREGLVFLSPEMRNRLPEGWGGEGVQNVGRGRPQFDETKFELGRNATGRYFLRPLTEFSGLSPAQVAAIREMDRRSTAQQALIKGAYSAAADTSAQEAQALGGRLAAIPGATGMTSAPSSTSASTGAGDMQRTQDIARSEQTLAATRAAAEAALRAPSIREQGIGYADQYATQAAAQRARSITDYRVGNADAQARSDAAEAALNARLRGQDLNLLGAQLRSGAQVSMNSADNARAVAVANANNQQQERNSVRQMQARLAAIDAQIKIANQRNDTTRAAQLTKLKQQEVNRYGNALRNNLRLVPDVAADGETPIPVPQQRSQLVQMLVSQGVPRATAIAMARAAIK